MLFCSWILQNNNNNDEDSRISVDMKKQITGMFFFLERNAQEAAWLPRTQCLRHAYLLWILKDWLGLIYVLYICTCIYICIYNVYNQGWRILTYSLAWGHRQSMTHETPAQCILYANAKFRHCMYIFNVKLAANGLSPVLYTNEILNFVYKLNDW